MSEECRRLNAEKLTQLGMSRAGVHPDVRASGKSGFRREADFQAAAERHIAAFGFVKLTPTNAQKLAGTEIPGWYGHVVRAPGNPFLPDIFVIAPRKQTFFCELKVRNKFGVGQREMIAAGWWHLATTMEEFCELFEDWKNDTGGRSV